VSESNVCFVDEKIPEDQLVSIVVPAFNTERRHFDDMVYSVINQHYQNWELVIVNASTDKSLKAYISQSKDKDSRIKIYEPEKNLGIAGNTNYGVKHAKGEFIAFLDHDDTLNLLEIHGLKSD